MATDRSKKVRARQKTAEKLVMLAHKFNPKLHVIDSSSKRERAIRNWYIHEKIDGIRAVFKDGELISRYGNKLYAPEEFIKNIHWPLSSTIHLDGELIHQDGLQKTGSIVRDQTKKNTMEYWKDIQYVVFDQIHDYDVPFWERLDDLKTYVAENDNVKILDKLGVVNDISDIYGHLKTIETAGGEGLILRNPESNYELGRSWNLIKVKSFEDIEVEVLDYYPGEGKYEGMIGGLVCKLYGGVQFECGSGLTDLERSNPPPIGSIVTIKFMGYTDLGKPRHAVYKGIRSYE